MRKLYNEFFYVPKHGKIREKVLLTRVAAIITIMIVCLATMSITAYAWFSYNIISGSNIIKAANFEVQVTIKDGNTDVPLTKDGKYQVADLTVGKEYIITLTAPNNEGAAETGFCVITADGCTNTYHTQQLGIDESVEGGKTPSITFTLKVSNNTKVKILSHWGTSSCYDPYKTNTTNADLYICDSDLVNITVVNTQSGINELDEDHKTATSPEGQGTVGEYTPPTETTPSAGNTTTPPAETTQPAKTTPPENTGTGEPTDTTEPITSTAEPTT